MLWWSRLIRLLVRYSVTLGESGLYKQVNIRHKPVQPFCERPHWGLMSPLRSSVRPSVVQGCDLRSLTRQRSLSYETLLTYGHPSFRLITPYDGADQRSVSLLLKGGFIGLVSPAAKLDVGSNI